MTIKCTKKDQHTKERGRRVQWTAGKQLNIQACHEPPISCPDSSIVCFLMWATPSILV